MVAKSDEKSGSLVERFKRGTVIIDGGLSTQLESQGVTFGTSLWTAQALLDNPEEIERAHRAFVDAGAEVLITASYQISREGFVAIGRSMAEADEALEASVDVARRASATTATLVAASVGPYGAVLHDGSEYRGNYGLTREALTAFHRERLVVLAHAHPDAFAIETIPDLIEVEAILDALDVAPAIPAWITVTAGPDGNLWAGQTLTDFAAVVNGHEQIVAIGVNCLDPDLVDGALKELREATDLPLVVYANGGGTWSATTGQWSNPHRTPSSETLARWQQLGARGIGGCCGVDADQLAKMAECLVG